MKDVSSSWCLPFFLVAADTSEDSTLFYASESVHCFLDYPCPEKCKLLDSLLLQAVES